jgi:hypothetical protein
VGPLYHTRGAQCAPGGRIALRPKIGHNISKPGPPQGGYSSRGCFQRPRLFPSSVRCLVQKPPAFGFPVPVARTLFPISSLGSLTTR